MSDLFKSYREKLSNKFAKRAIKAKRSILVRDTTEVQQSSIDISNLNSADIPIKSRFFDEIDRANLKLSSQETIQQPSNLSEWLLSDSDKASRETLLLIKKINSKNQPSGFSANSVKRRWRNVLQKIKIKAIESAPRQCQEEYNWILKSVNERVLIDIHKDLMADCAANPKSTIFYRNLNTTAKQKKSFFPLDENNHVKLINFVKLPKSEWLTLLYDHYDAQHFHSPDQSYAKTYKEDEKSLMDIYDGLLNQNEQDSSEPLQDYRNHRFQTALKNQVNENNFIFSNQFMYQMILNKSLIANNASKSIPTKEINNEIDRIGTHKKLNIGIDLNIILENIFHDESLKTLFQSHLMPNQMNYPTLFKNSTINTLSLFDSASLKTDSDQSLKSDSSMTDFFENGSFDDTWRSYLSHPLESVDNDYIYDTFKSTSPKKMIGVMQLQKLNELLKSNHFNRNDRNRGRSSTIDYSDLKENRIDFRYFMTEKSLKLSEARDIRKIREFLFPDFQLKNEPLIIDTDVIPLKPI